MSEPIAIGPAFKDDHTKSYKLMQKLYEIAKMFEKDIKIVLVQTPDDDTNILTLRDKKRKKGEKNV